MSSSTENKDDLHDDQIEDLTNQIKLLTEENEELIYRLDYVEDIVLTLVMALKDAGIIVMEDDGDYDFTAASVDEDEDEDYEDEEDDDEDYEDEDEDYEDYDEGE